MSVDFSERARAWVENNRHRLATSEQHAVQSLAILLRHVHEVGRQEGMRGGTRHPSSGRISVSDEVKDILEGRKR